MLNNPPNLNALWASFIVEELIRNGVDTFCVSLGSRSTPLAMAVATGDPLTHFVHHDERALAFFALGHAKATQRPVAFICTSGTAVANALPAVAEAAQAHVPLIVITADRPAHLHDSGANQTMPQSGLYRDFTRWHHDFPTPSLDVPPEYVLTTVDQAVHRSLSAPPGPVHLNCPFDEPLAPDPVDFDHESYTRNLASWFDGPFTQYALPVRSPNPTQVDNVLSMLRQDKRGFIVAGQLSSNEDIAAAKLLAEVTGWPLLPDATSCLRFGNGPETTIHHYDFLLETNYIDLFNASSFIVHVGGAVTSKRLQKFLASTPSRYYIRIANHPHRLDPLHRVSHRLDVQLSEFVRIAQERGQLTADASWVADLMEASKTAGKLVEETVGQEAPLTEIGVVRSVLKSSPSERNVYLGNSLPIREADTFGDADGAGCRIFANRGVSGIDGNIATLAGHAAGLGQGVTAILGDLTTLHDLTSLGLLNKSRAPIVLIVLNNDGGGIFSFLPIAEHDTHFETFFGTPHGRSFDAFAKGYDIDYYAPSDILSFEAEYAKCIDNGRHALIEIKTNRRDTESIQRKALQTIWKKLNDSA